MADTGNEPRDTGLILDGDDMTVVRVAVRGWLRQVEDTMRNLSLLSEEGATKYAQQIKYQRELVDEARRVMHKLDNAPGREWVNRPNR